jgi:hypothetical protein
MATMFDRSPLELAGPVPRPRAGAVTGSGFFGGQISMKTVRPDKTDPIPMRTEPPRMGTIMIRFVGLLAVAVVVLALIYSR